MAPDQASLQPPEEGAQGALTVFQTLSGHPQHIGRAVEHGPGSVVEHLASTDAVVRAQSQPGGEMLLAGPPVHVEPDLGNQRLQRSAHRAHRPRSDPLP